MSTRTMVHSFPLILVPTVAGTIFTGVALPIFVGEILSRFWLMFKDLDEDAWGHQHGRRRELEEVPS